MSIKVTSAMSELKGNKIVNVPRLRFPEFRTEEAWRYKVLSPYLKEHSERVPTDTDLPIYSSTRTGLRPQKEYFDNRELSNAGEYGVVPEGFFVYRHMSDDGSFKFNINRTGGPIAVSKEYPVFTTVDLDPEFLLQLLNDGDAFKKFAQAQKKGGTRTRLYLSSLREWDVLLPTFPEQEKIARCLSSLDALISVETQKLEALYAYKKGLMQRLFPQDGMSVPRLRFPEFRTGAEWQPKSIGASCESFSGGTPNTSNKAFYGRDVPFIRSAEINKTKTELFLTNEGLENSSAQMVRQGDILVALYGANSGEVAISKINGAINQAILCLRHETSNQFVYQYLAHKKEWIIETFVQGGQGNLSGAIVKAITLFFPKPEEQQRVGQFLSSCDAVITTQIQAIEEYKLHKKGLMQKLFPVPTKEF
jgi:type I restriction enzyme S subunit